tara:strand:- start:773 stop:1264 length:492 start_codon:yes stop_codon:yes gene_type:complete
MYLFHYPETIIQNHQFLFLCEKCLTEALINMNTVNYNFFVISDLLKSIIIQDDVFFKNYNWNHLQYEGFANFTTYGSLFLFFLTWYEYNQFTHFALYYCIDLKGIPFKDGTHFIDYYLYNSNLDESTINNLMNLRHRRILETYSLSGLKNLFPDEIVNYISLY